MARSVVCDVMMIVIGVIILYGRLLRLRCLATALIALPQAGRVYLSLSVCLYGCVCLWLLALASGWLCRPQFTA